MTDTQVLSVEQAEQELRKARDLAAELEARLKDGELSISLDEVMDARNAVEFSEMRLEGSRAAARREAEEARLQSAAVLHDEAVAIFGRTTSEIAEAHDQVVTALAKLGEVVTQHNVASENMAARCEELRPAELSLDKPLPEEVRAVMKVGSLRVDRFSPLKVALAALHTGFDGVELRRVQETEWVRELRGPNQEELRLVREIAETAKSEAQ